MLGPLDENAATTGEGRMPTCVSATTIVAVGFGPWGSCRRPSTMYDFIAVPFVSPTPAGTRTTVVAVGFGSEATYDFVAVPFIFSAAQSLREKDVENGIMYVVGNREKSNLAVFT